MADGQPDLPSKPTFLRGRLSHGAMLLRFSKTMRLSPGLVFIRTPTDGCGRIFGGQEHLTYNQLQSPLGQLGGTIMRTGLAGYMTTRAWRMLSLGNFRAARVATHSTGIAVDMGWCMLRLHMGVK